jgi:hypothetical protein
MWEKSSISSKRMDSPLETLRWLNSLNKMLKNSIKNTEESLSTRV